MGGKIGWGECKYEGWTTTECIGANGRYIVISLFIQSVEQ